jgi:hypothetical protein
MGMSNDFIAHHGLIELRRSSGKYTCTNKQVMPTMYVLDRVLGSTEWEILFPLANLVVGTRIGSDHSPLIISSRRIKREKLQGFTYRNSGSCKRGLQNFFLETVSRSRGL